MFVDSAVWPQQRAVKVRSGGELEADPERTRGVKRAEHILAVVEQRSRRDLTSGS